MVAILRTVGASDETKPSIVFRYLGEEVCLQATSTDTWLMGHMNSYIC